jgi:hypothetical protein
MKTSNDSDSAVSRRQVLVVLCAIGVGVFSAAPALAGGDQCPIGAGVPALSTWGITATAVAMAVLGVHTIKKRGGRAGSVFLALAVLTVAPAIHVRLAQAQEVCEQALKVDISFSCKVEVSNPPAIQPATLTTFSTCDGSATGSGTVRYGNGFVNYIKIGNGIDHLAWNLSKADSTIPRKPRLNYMFFNETLVESVVLGSGNGDFGAFGSCTQGNPLVYSDCLVHGSFQFQRVGPKAVITLTFVHVHVPGTFAESHASASYARCTNASGVNGSGSATAVPKSLPGAARTIVWITGKLEVFCT